MCRHARRSLFFAPSMRDRIGPLDGLRGLAVLMVFMSHTSGRDQELLPFLDFQGIGRIGVYLFFCLSAFLLSLKLFKTGIDKKSLTGFALKRSWRIIPLYFTVVTGVYLVQVLTGSYNERYLHIKDGLVGYLRHLLFYQGDGVFWSIVSEVQFYLIVPVIIWGILTYGRRALLLFGIIALTNAFIYGLFAGFGLPYIKYLSPNLLGYGTYIDVFITGILGAYVVHFYSDFLEKHKATIAKVASVIFIGTLLLTCMLVTQNFFGLHAPFYGFRHLTLIHALAFTLTIVSVYMGNPMNRWLSAKWLQYTGLVGFSFYLLHMGIIYNVNRLELPSYVLFFISAAGTYIVASVGFYLIEKPSIARARKALRSIRDKKRETT